jgi:hypothetical protein
VRAAAEPAWYVYGIVPEDVELSPDARGVGDPPGRIRLVRHGGIAALVSDIQPAQPVRRPADLRAHRDLLDATVAEVPVLPVRSSTIVATREALVEQLLGPHHDEFQAALRELDGHAEYLIEAGSDGRPGARRGPRDTDSAMIVDAVAGYCAATQVRRPADADDDQGSAADVAVLMAMDREPDVKRALGELARDRPGGAGLRLRGPIAPYDFVTDLTPQE